MFDWISICSEKNPKDGSAMGAACACLDGWGGATCTEATLTEEKAIEQAQEKIDSKSTVIAVVVTLVSLAVEVANKV